MYERKVMAGILDPKQRIMDVIITENGRRQMADGTFGIYYASFSDHGVFYRKDGNLVADDAGARIMFEAGTSSTDVIIPEINDRGSIDIQLSSGNSIVGGRPAITGSSNPSELVLSGTMNMFSSSIEVMKTAIEHFDRLQVIGSDSAFGETQMFRLDKNEVSFDFPVDNIPEDIDTLSPLYLDKRFAGHPNYRYLAPVYEESNSLVQMALYPRITQQDHATFDTLLDELEPFPSTTVHMQNLNNSNNLLAQVFETTPIGINKLAIIDYGAYIDSQGAMLGHVFYLGKLVKDSTQVPKFINIMTLIFGE
jgi:hypothetical protein